MAPWWAWLLSWMINLALISVLVALIDMKEEYVIERLPWAGFFFAFVLPTLFEIICWWQEGVPFLSLVLPGFGLLY